MYVCVSGGYNVLMFKLFELRNFWINANDTKPSFTALLETNKSSLGCIRVSKICFKFNLL